MLANSDNKHDLIDHLLGVCKLAMIAAKRLGLSEDLIEKAGVAGLLHDIGKADPSFQSFIQAQITGKKYNYKSEYRHHEISWAYAVCHEADADKMEDIYQAIYWHHATNLYSFKLDEINSQNITDSCEKDNIFEKIDKLIESLVFDLGNCNINLNVADYIGEFKDRNLKIDYPFVEHTHRAKRPRKRILEYIKRNAERMLIRGCLVFADRCISKLSNIELKSFLLNDDGIESFFDNRIHNVKFNCPKYYNSERFNLQKDIVSKTEQTTFVNAPAGLGKTIIGLMWAFRQSGVVYWVTPTNAIAEAVYANIIEELKAFGIKANIELFLTGKRKDAYPNKDIEDTDVHIIVTNIDNVLSPTVSGQTMGSLYTVENCSVVFDEYDKFSGSEPMYSAFSSYMYARHYLSDNAKTLLLSATPAGIQNIINSFSEKKPVCVLPENGKHYPAQHEKKYMFSASFDVDVAKNRTNNQQRHAVMLTSIHNVQRYDDKHRPDYCIHSFYTDTDKDKNMNLILSEYGKNGNSKKNIVTSPISIVGTDISYNNASKVVESPEYDIQALGRVNRWGKNNTANVELVFTEDKSELSAIRIRASNNRTIYDQWNEFVKNKLIEKSFNLDEVYSLYNEFHHEKEPMITEVLYQLLSDSLRELHSFYPVDFGKRGNGNQRKIGKTLRTASVGCFITTRDHNGEWLKEAIQVPHYLKEDIINISGDRDKLNKDYSEIAKDFPGVDKALKIIEGKKYNFEKLFRLAKSDQCPIPVDEVFYYDPRQGLKKK